MHGAFFACAAATNFVQWSLRATSTGSIRMPGFAASNSAIVFFHTGSYCDSVRFAVCHCRTIGCCAIDGAIASDANATASVARIVERVMTPPDALSSIQRAAALGARLRPISVLLQKREIGLDAETGSVGQHECAVLEADRRGARTIAQFALRLHLLEDQEVRHRRGEVHRCCHADRSARVV